MEPRVRRRFTVLLGLLLTTTLVAGACSSSSSTTTTTTTPLTAWAGQVCTAIQGFADQVSDSQKRMQDQLSQANLAEGASVTDALQGFVSNLGSAAQATATQIQNIGPPPIPEGQQVQTALTNGFKAAEDLVARLQEGAQQLQTEGASALLNVGPQVLAAFGQAQAALGSLITTVQTEVPAARDSLNQAFNTAASCQQLQSTTTTAS